MYCQRFALGLLCVTTLWACDGGSTSDSSVDEADTHGEDAATVDSDAAAETPDAETPDAGPLDVGTADVAIAGSADARGLVDRRPRLSLRRIKAGVRSPLFGGHVARQYREFREHLNCAGRPKTWNRTQPRHGRAQRWVLLDERQTGRLQLVDSHLKLGDANDDVVCDGARDDRRRLGPCQARFVRGQRLTYRHRVSTDGPQLEHRFARRLPRLPLHAFDIHEQNLSVRNIGLVALAHRAGKVV